ncbi:hypothetical protein EV424DRAFT_1534651 [Suillus variegatus]|nr:hypothetical protein EV424DRAFT_1534651 [Suillus variegatus]
MLAHGVPRESHIFPPSRHHTGHIGPHDKTMDTYASKHQRLLQSCGQEQPSITSIINVSGRDKGSKLYVAPKGNKDSYGRSQVNPSSYRTAITHSKNAPPHPCVIPPRFQKQHAAPMGKPNPSFDHSTSPKQQCIPVSSTCGRITDTNSFIVDSPLSSHQKSQSPAPILDIKAALFAEGIHIGIQSSASHPQPPTEPHLHIDQHKSQTLPTPTEPTSHHDIQPLGVKLGSHMQILNTSSEPPKRPPGLQSPAGRGVALPMPSVNVSLPPPSKAKKWARKERSSGPECSVAELEAVTIKPETPEPSISSSSVKLPSVRERSRSSSPKPSIGESTAPTSSNLATQDMKSPTTSSKDEMCRKWFFRVCDRGRWCPYAHTIIPTNLTCKLWLNGECNRRQCPFAHKHQSSNGPVSNQLPAQNDDPQDAVQVADGPVKDQPSVRNGNVRDSVQVPDHLVKYTLPVQTGNTQDSVQIPTGPVKDQLPVRCTEVLDHPVNDQRNGKPREGGKVPEGSVKSQVSVRNGGARGTIYQDSTRPPSSDTSSSAQCSMTQVPPSGTTSRGSERQSQAASTNTTPENTGHKVPSNPDGHQPKQVCHDWLQGRCRRPVCRYLHERPNDNTSRTRLSVRNGDPRDVVQVADSPVKDQPPVRNGNVRDSVQVPDRHVEYKPPVQTGNARDSVQVPAGPVKDQLPVRCTEVPDRPVNDQRNGKPREGGKVPEGSVKSQAPVRNGTLIPIPPDSTRPPSSDTTNSAQCSVTQVPPSGTKSRGSERHSQVASTITTPEYTGHKASNNLKVCYDWLQSRCMRDPCPFSHKRPNDNTSQTNTPSPVRNTCANGAPASGNSPSRHPPPSLPPPTTRRNEDLVIPVTIADHITVKLRSGFDVQDVTTGFETRWVHLGDVSPDVKESQLRSLLKAYQVDELCIPDGKDAKRLTVKVQFSTAAQAMEASVALHGRQIQGRRLTAKLTLNTTACRTTVLKDTAVRITWSAPQRVGYAGYATLNEAKAAIAAATGLAMRDNVLTAALYEGLPAVGVYNVMFSHLPPDAERKDLEQFGNAESILLERPNYESLESARHAVLRILQSCGNVSNFDLVLPIWNGTVLVWATFETHADASNARDHLDGQHPRAIGGKTYISARHVQSLNFSLPLSKFKMLQEDIARLRWTWRTRFNHDVTLFDRLTSPDGPVHIRISAANVSNLGIAKAEFEQLQHGEVVTLQRKPIWDRFFSEPSGHSFLRELESRYTGIGLRTRMGKILLLGPIEQRQLARKDIMTRFQELQARQWWRIPLSGRVVGPFVGTDLVTLQKTLGPENCYVHYISNQRNLVVRGNEQAYRIACEAVEKVQSRYADSSTAIPRISILTCGHTWCTSCLESYLVSAVENKTFPLTCLGADASCTERISTALAKKILSGDDFAALV